MCLRLNIQSPSICHSRKNKTAKNSLKINFSTLKMSHKTFQAVKCIANSLKHKSSLLSPNTTRCCTRFLSEGKMKIFMWKLRNELKIRKLQQKNRQNRQVHNCFQSFFHKLLSLTRRNLRLNKKKIKNKKKTKKRSRTSSGSE